MATQTLAPSKEAQEAAQQARLNAGPILMKLRGTHTVRDVEYLMTEVTGMTYEQKLAALAEYVDVVQWREKHHEMPTNDTR